MNRLGTQSSPYLRQHANDPVDWFPWGDEAFAEAERLDRPVMLSVGYSACHWCHVMAHESFQDAETARLLNDTVVSVKVDREERPDVDALYMEAVTATTGGGGWPMTVFLTPDRKPFFAGTYFPAVRMGDMPAFRDVIGGIAHAWTRQRAELRDQAERLTQAVAARLSTLPASDQQLDRAMLDQARKELIGWHDKEWGGFGSAPKFPQSMALELLMRTGNEEAMTVVRNSLEAMASGGIYDHLGGGFHRYSVDSFWMVPHFEKMLYDQALLARTYLHAFQITGNEVFAQVASETIEYVLRDLVAPGGAFFTAEDADSEGEESVFYIWRPETIDEVCGADAAAFRAWYGVTQSGNFEGSNILHRPARGDLLRTNEVERARAALFAARTNRVRPGLDDKILLEPNAMFIATLAESGAALGRSEWLAEARRATRFLLENLRDESGRWFRTWHGLSGRQHPAFSVDYAHLLDAFTRLGEATGEAVWRRHAIETADAMHELFWDADDGGLVTNGRDAEQLLVNPKDISDGAVPSANATAAVALERLARLTDNAAYRERALQICSLGGTHLAHQPSAFPTLLAAVDALTAQTTETLIAACENGEEMVRAVNAAYLPNNVVMWGERDDAPLWEGRIEGGYVCTGQTCKPQRLNSADLLDDLVN